MDAQPPHTTDSPPTTTTTRLAGRYELGEPLGRGRSTVFRASDTRLQRDVAIKQVELALGDEDSDRARTRAMREAQAAARLNDPAVVTVYDVVEQDGAIWLVMELVEAPSLAQLVEAAPLTHPRAARIGLDVLAALDAAHQVGIVHRDAKPANVLVTDGDRAKLTDFGVATIRDESRLTATGFIVGSPSYMAPEQARGADVGPPTDLWALGAMLYYATEGVPPFSGDSAVATASAVVHGEPRPARSPGGLTGLIARLLTKDPDHRPPAAQVRATLSRVAEVSVSDRPVDGRAARTRRQAIAGTAYPTAGPSAAGRETRAGRAAAAGPAAAADPPADPAARTRRQAAARDTPADAAAGPDAAALTWLEGAGTGGPTDPTVAAPATAGRPQPGSPAYAPARPAASPPIRRSSRGPARTGPSARTRGRIGVIVLVVVALVAVAAAAGALRDRGGGDDNAPSTSTTAAGTATGAPATTAAPTTTPEAAPLPAGWRAYHDAAGGYTIGYPPGWRVVRGPAPRIDLRDPGTGTDLQIVWTATPPPDLVADWRRQAKTFAQRHPGYHEIGIAPARYRNYKAARWEFLFGTGAARTHAADLRFVTGGKAYALLFHAPEADWAKDQALLTNFQATFQP